MVSLIALIVGGLGVGATMQSHLRQKMTNIAFMKCIGGRSEHILYIYLAQALWLGILGSVLGAILGAFAQSVFARLIANYFDVQVTLIWPVAAMLQGIVAGLATTALFSLPALLAIRAVRPIDIAAESLRWGILGSAGPCKLDRGRSGHCGPLGNRSVGQRITALCDRVRRKPRLPRIFILGLIGALLLRVMKRLSSLEAVRHSRTLKHGIGNLYRPGAHSVAILTSLAIGVMFVMSVYFIQHSLLDEIRIAAPPDAPNVFLINITSREKDGVTKILESEPAIVNRQALSPAVSATLASVDGTPIDQLSQGVATRRFTNTVFVLTWSEALPAATEILQGKWWDPKPSEPLVSVNEVAAENLGIRLRQHPGLECARRLDSGAGGQHPPYRRGAIRSEQSIRSVARDSRWLCDGVLWRDPCETWRHRSAAETDVRKLSHGHRRQCRGHSRHHSGSNGQDQPGHQFRCGLRHRRRPDRAGFECCGHAIPANAGSGHFPDRRRHESDACSDLYGGVRRDRNRGRTVGISPGDSSLFGSRGAASGGVVSLPLGSGARSYRGNGVFDIARGLDSELRRAPEETAGNSAGDRVKERCVIKKFRRQ